MQNPQYITSARKEANTNTKRKCHDCGKPTTNYRCRSCLQKFYSKHGVQTEDRIDRNGQGARV